MARSKIQIAKAGQTVEALEDEEWEGEHGSTIHAGYRSTVTSSGTVHCGDGSMVFGRSRAHLIGLRGCTFYAEANCTFEAFPFSNGFAETGSSGVVHKNANVKNRGGKITPAANK